MEARQADRKDSFGRPSALYGLFFFAFQETRGTPDLRAVIPNRIAGHHEPTGMHKFEELDFGVLNMPRIIHNYAISAILKCPELILMDGPGGTLTMKGFIMETGNHTCLEQTPCSISKGPSQS
jgi:hypothetical protein